MSFSALMAPDPRVALVTQCDTVLKRQKAADYVIEDDAGALKGHVQPTFQLPWEGNVQKGIVVEYLFYIL
jgi:hypothetical protein